jgi:hypothetical protein
MPARSRAPFTTCKLFYDAARVVEIGHFLLTPAGSAYLVQSVRTNRNRPHRKHMQCVRWPADEIPPGAIVHPLHWYARRRRTTTLAAIARRASQ